MPTEEPCIVQGQHHLCCAAEAGEGGEIEMGPPNIHMQVVEVDNVRNERQSRDHVLAARQIEILPAEEPVAMVSPMQGVQQVACALAHFWVGNWTAQDPAQNPAQPCFARGI